MLPLLRASCTLAPSLAEGGVMVGCPGAGESSSTLVWASAGGRKVGVPSGRRYSMPVAGTVTTSGDTRATASRARTASVDDVGAAWASAGLSHEAAKPPANPAKTAAAASRVMGEREGGCMGDGSPLDT